VKREIYIEPLTRIEGHLGVQSEADFKANKYTDAHVYGTMFRGLEVILKGREPADAIWLTQRTCGVCPVPHATASVECIDMTYNVSPPPFAIALRNLVFLAEQLYDAPLGCGILQGADYSAAIMKKYNPDLFSKAEKTKSPKAHLHGYETISQIMEGLNPVEGSIWQKCIGASKIGLKMLSILGGKHPHISIFLPGGVAKTLNIAELESYYSLLAQQIAFTKEFTAIFDDLIDFLTEAGLDKIGEREANLISYGNYEDPTSYDARYQNMSLWGEKRFTTPGIVINGNLLTTDLVEINVGINEFVTHSYYENTSSHEYSQDPKGNPLRQEHPWNAETRYAPGKEKNWQGKYSWAKAPRWLDHKKRIDGGHYVVEAGPIARMWITAQAKKVKEATGKGLKFSLPQTNIVGCRVPQELEFHWQIPNKVNALERIRARAYFHAYSALVAYKMFVMGVDLINKKQVKVWQDYTRPKEGMGVGLVEAMRGAVAHWCIMRKGKIHRYQIITPTGWNASPRDHQGLPGPYEEAIINTPVDEKDDKNFEGINVVRTVRSFDPCLACTVHLYTPEGKILKTQELDHRH
jgi:hydrogenase large subunit